MADDDDRVGYGRPPKHSRFKPGQSGNPRGRKRGVKGATQVLAASLSARVTVTVDGRRRSISKLEAIATQLTNKAAGGDPKATKLMFDLVRSYGDRLFDTGAVASAGDEAGMVAMLARIGRLQGGGS